jgi:lipid II:glycine glycyltransferase (peptidoglycan interpeptide bridge formation enzyme)
MTEIALFWRPEYATLHMGKVELIGISQTEPYFRTIVKEDDILECSSLILLRRVADRVEIPAFATFGGLWSTGEDYFVTKDLSTFISQMQKEFGVKVFEFHFPPSYFYPNLFDNQIKNLEKFGAVIDYIDCTYHLDVSDWDVDQFSKGNRKKLRQCTEAGVKVEKFGTDRLKDCFRIIELNRQQMGIVPSISLAALEEAMRKLPGIYECYGASVGDQLIASAITVRIDSKIQYVYMWADMLEYRHLSPVVPLCKFLIENGKNEGLEILDLGISSVDGIENNGLSRFKENLGAIRSEKITIKLFDTSVLIS